MGLTQSYALVEINQTPCFEGRSSIDTEIAVSNSEESLEKYCESILKHIVIKPDMKKPNWENYYIIKPTKLLII